MRYLPVPMTRAAESILTVRGQRVILDLVLAALYRVRTKALLQAVRRNRVRFPGDFMFRLTKAELVNLRSQIVTSSWGGRRFRAYAFTEQGVAMLSSVLRSPRAIRVNIEIMRAFVQLKRMMGSNAELARKLALLERRYDVRFRVVFEAIRRLMAAPKAVRRRMGFLPR